LSFLSGPLDYASSYSDGIFSSTLVQCVQAESKGARVQAAQAAYKNEVWLRGMQSRKGKGTGNLPEQCLGGGANFAKV
jgi:hypothetical protein